MPHDRDGSVDRLLRGALGPRSTPRVAGPCLDADTAAAWADDTLAGDDRSAAEAHAANCARCQALLAAIAKTTPTAPAAPRWRFWSAGWLVPLTGALAGALVWSVMHSGRATQSAQHPGTPVDSLASASSTIATGVEKLENEKLENKDERVAHDRVSSGGKRRAAKVAESPRLQDAGDRSKDRDAAAPPPLAETVGVTAGVTGRLETAKASVALAKSPLRWQIGPGGSVQRSADGSTWQTEQPDVPGALVPFTALSSPSPTVCWLVGVRGTVFMTVDGRTWQRVGFPEPVDLVAVRAIDEMAATVTTSDGRRFTTPDRGATWSQVQAR